MKVRRALTGCAALAIAVTLGACNGSPEAGTVDTPTATETTESGTEEPTDAETTEPTSDEPTEPVPELTEVPGEGPEITFVKHFFDMHNYARRTGDVEPFLALADADCESCEGSANWISEKYEAGGYVEGGQLELVDEPLLVPDPEQPEVRVTYRETAMTVVASADAEPDERPECDGLAYTVELTPDGDQWLVEQFYVQTACE